MSATIKVYDSVKDMTGIGEEWLVDANGNPLVIFIDGNFRCAVIPIGNVDEVTKAAA